MFADFYKSQSSGQIKQIKQTLKHIIGKDSEPSRIGAIEFYHQPC